MRKKLYFNDELVQERCNIFLALNYRFGIPNSFTLCNVTNIHGNSPKNLLPPTPHPKKKRLMTITKISIFRVAHSIALCNVTYITMIVSTSKHTSPYHMHTSTKYPRPQLVKKTPSYWYRESHYKPETVVRPSQVYNEDSYTCKTVSS